MPALAPDGAWLRAGTGYELVPRAELGLAVQGPAPQDRADRDGADGDRADQDGADQDGADRDGADRDGADLYGMLRPRPGSGLEPRSVSPDTALLFLTLQRPGALPAYARAELGGRAATTLARLVLDGVLELEHDGRWHTGSPAAELLFPRPAGGGTGRIGELSLAALRYGQELGELGEDQLARRLYDFGRCPIGPELLRRLPDAAAVAAALGLGAGGPVAARLAGGWVEAGQAAGYWRHWRPRRPAADPRARRAAVKLYVSPAVDALPAALAVLAEELADHPAATAFKLGADLGGICRPDKLVVYFDRLDELQETAAALTPRLAGLPAHGVPFTAAVTPDGMLSWGADPPDGGSWRLRVVRGLAEHLRRGLADGVAEPWRFALDRIRLSGVDPDTWRPA